MDKSLPGAEPRDWRRTRRTNPDAAQPTAAQSWQRRPARRIAWQTVGPRKRGVWNMTTMTPGVPVRVPRARPRRWPARSPDASTHAQQGGIGQIIIEDVQEAAQRGRDTLESAPRTRPAISTAYARRRGPRGPASPPWADSDSGPDRSGPWQAEMVKMNRARSNQAGGILRQLKKLLGPVRGGQHARAGTGTRPHFTRCRVARQIPANARRTGPAMASARGRRPRRCATGPGTQGKDKGICHTFEVCV